MAFVVVARTQVDRISLPPAFCHAQDIHEKPEAVLELRREQFDMPQMRHVHDCFVFHHSLRFSFRCVSWSETTNGSKVETMSNGIPCGGLQTVLRYSWSARRSFKTSGPIAVM